MKPERLKPSAHADAKLSWDEVWRRRNGLLP
jgi:hypothetical protein